MNLVARECSAAPGIVQPPNAGQQTQTGQTARRIWESVRVMMSVATTTSVWRDCAEGDESFRTRPKIARKVCCLALCSILPQNKTPERYRLLMSILIYPLCKKSSHLSQIFVVVDSMLLTTQANSYYPVSNSSFRQEESTHNWQTEHRYPHSSTPSLRSAW